MKEDSASTNESTADRAFVHSRLIGACRTSAA